MASTASAKILAPWTTCRLHLRFIRYSSPATRQTNWAAFSLGCRKWVRYSRPLRADAVLFRRFPASGATTGAPAFSGTSAGFFGLATPLHWVVPTTQQWNLTLQRQLGGNWVFELGYVGTKGTRLRSTFDPDQPSLASPAQPHRRDLRPATAQMALPTEDQIHDHH